jgi:hypothetical protein
VVFDRSHGTIKILCAAVVRVVLRFG